MLVRSPPCVVSRTDCAAARFLVLRLLGDAGRGRMPRRPLVRRADLRPIRGQTDR